MHVIELKKPGGPEVLELVERALPEPAAHEVRVRAEAIGVNSADAAAAGASPARARNDGS